VASTRATCCAGGLSDQKRASQNASGQQLPRPSVREAMMCVATTNET
jgi:hypothetical protein